MRTFVYLFARLGRRTQLKVRMNNFIHFWSHIVAPSDFNPILSRTQSELRSRSIENIRNVRSTGETINILSQRNRDRREIATPIARRLANRNHRRNRPSYSLNTTARLSTVPLRIQSQKRQPVYYIDRSVPEVLRSELGVVMHGEILNFMQASYDAPMHDTSSATVHSDTALDSSDPERNRGPRPIEEDRITFRLDADIHAKVKERWEA